MDIWNRFSGTVRIRMVCAEPERMIAVLNRNGIVLHDVNFADPLTVSFLISARDYESLKSVSKITDVKITAVSRKGFCWTILTLWKRPVLLIGFCILMLLSLSVPGRIFFVEVKGNADIPTNLIISRASDCGIDFGASRRDVRSEKVKNALLQSIPQLQWVGVNTTGCVAVIGVQERASSDTVRLKGMVSNIVADTDAIIKSYTVIKGSPLITVGLAVKAGQVLVSGYTDCGLTVKASRSEAEILGETTRRICVISPGFNRKRGELIDTQVKYYLQIGKNIIKFSKDSGISDTECVKMYESISVKLPGGFQIPVSVIKQTCCYYTHVDSMQLHDADWLTEQATAYVCGQMVAGRIVQDQTSVQHDANAIRLIGNYICLEEIGRIKYEEILHGYE